MFTGIIEEVGQVVSFADLADGSARLTVRAPLAVSDARHGDSISVGGVCLTVVDQGEDWFAADVMGQTLAVSALAGVASGDPVNLERAARVGDRLGGHIVQGHVDGVATLLARTDLESWRVLRFAIDPALAPLLVDKGSITVAGVSLTVSAVSPAEAPEGSWFEVSLIPETLAATTLGSLEVGGAVNVETDVLARHVQRLLAFGTAAAAPPVGAEGGAR
ncbi:MAG: riboflavin synthase subunit alpha [Naasia sp.]|uniref:riboflavin synthase n=1 Tax=Naasia sp. TaxID=2546198 RepID=UPI0026295860|nr:riboflavin synthase [Naasia sp.]MCU1569895.1 riboflavin synthase subunit alpha [Naasia sp.]